MIIRRDWTPREDAILQQGALTGQTVGEIARNVGRTMSAVLARARNHQIKLRRSTSKSLSAPYGLIPGGVETRSQRRRVVDN
jgi:hypothetical protein